MEKIKDLVKRRSTKSKSVDEGPASRRSADMPAARTLEGYHPASDKELPPVPAVDTTAAHQSGSSTPLRSSSQWGKPAQEKSPTYSEQQQVTPTASASAVLKRESSLQVKRASPPHIEEDYDQYRNMLAQSATGSRKGDQDIFHDASEEAQAPTSTTDQQKASRDYGRRQIHGTDGNDLNMQGLSIVDDGTGIGRASTEPIPMNEANSNTQSSTEPTANKRNATTRKALPLRPQDNTSPRGHGLRHKPSDTDLQDQAQTQAQPSYLPKLDQHPPPSTISPTTNEPHHTYSTSPHPDPLARLPPSFNPTNTIDTTVDTTIAPAVTHETLHTKRIEIVQEAITRDIHVDHYYHYVQPLKVVEVKPAKHFRINSKGEKLSIAAPEGWEMPSDMSVRRAPDFVNDEGNDSGIGAVGGGKLGWGRRDYVVDEENPKGRMLSKEELEQERVKGHLVSPVGVGGSGVSSPVRDSEKAVGVAR